MRELVLRELVENVALVLVPVAPAQEPPAAALPVALDAGIVPGRDIVIPQQERPVAAARRTSGMRLQSMHGFGVCPAQYSATK